MEISLSTIIIGLVFCVVSFFTGYFLNRPSVVKNRKFRELNLLELAMVFAVSIGYPILFVAVSLLFLTGASPIGVWDTVCVLAFVVLISVIGDLGLNFNSRKTKT